MISPCSVVASRPVKYKSVTKEHCPAAEAETLVCGRCAACGNKIVRINAIIVARTDVADSDSDSESHTDYDYPHILLRELMGGQPEGE